MKILVAKNLYVADDSELCHIGKENQVIVHACKYPCHKLAVGYDTKIDPSHPNYLYKEMERDLYLNMIDPQVPMFRLELFVKAKEFIKKHIDNNVVVIHCNAGQSRSPMLAMLYINTEDDYAKAKASFKGIYPHFSPTTGIDTFVRDNWGTLK